MASRYAPLAVLGLAFGLAACGPDTYFPPTDFERAGTWQAEGINDRNLRAMVADPSNLTRGVGAATARGDAGASAVAALDACRRPQLPSSSLSRVGSTVGGGSDPSVSASGCADATGSNVSVAGPGGGVITVSSAGPGAR